MRQARYRSGSKWPARPRLFRETVAGGDVEHNDVQVPQDAAVVRGGREEGRPCQQRQRRALFDHDDWRRCGWRPWGRFSLTGHVCQPRNFIVFVQTSLLLLDCTSAIASSASLAFTSVCNNLVSLLCRVQFFLSLASSRTDQSCFLFVVSGVVDLKSRQGRKLQFLDRQLQISDIDVWNQKIGGEFGYRIRLVEPLTLACECSLFQIYICAKIRLKQLLRRLVSSPHASHHADAIIACIFHQRRRLIGRPSLWRHTHRLSVIIDRSLPQTNWLIMFLI